MVDIVDSKTRSRMMSNIRGRDTKIEVLVRKALWRKGFRYRMPTQKNYMGLPGIPDLVFPKYRAVIMLNGCFFHGHDCHLFRIPEQNQQTWLEKIQSNRERDARFAKIRRQQGWKTLTIWECALRGKQKLPFEPVIKIANDWLLFGTQDALVVGSKQYR
jgi:DNA mismatch endonuclease (patch repair protein)